MHTLLAFLVFLCSILAAWASSPVPFSWSNCGSTSDPIVLKSANITPVPVVFGQNLTISFEVDINETVNASVAASAVLVLKKEVFGVYITLPCILNIGSCTYQNVCSLLQNATNGTCPDFMVKNNIPCTCPVAVGSYRLSSQVITMPLPPPDVSFLTDGNYNFELSLLDLHTNRVACYTGYVSLTNNATSAFVPPLRRT